MTSPIYRLMKAWLYLAGHKDLFTGELVGYAMGRADDQESG